VSAHRRHRKASQPATSEAAVARTGSARLPWLWRAAVVLALVGAVAIVLARKPASDVTGISGPPRLAASHATIAMPRLVDVGADRCIPCKAMAPILEELRTAYAGRLQVDFIDVWKNPGAGEPYHVYMIPTQIFYGRDGTELERHQGFISKADILATWQRHGYDFATPAPMATEN